MRPLLWKELHDLRPWLLAGVVVTVSLELLLATRVFNPSFVSTWMEALMPFVAAIVSIGLAGGQIARERHTRTLDFLLVRPVSAPVIVWSKFAAGSFVLTLLMAGVVALGFAVPEFTSDIGLRFIREQVGFRQLFAVMLPRFWFLYGLTLFCSVLVDRSVKAAALAAVVVCTTAILAIAFYDLAPFSGFVYWLLFIDGSGGLIEAAKSPWLSAITGLVFSLAALSVTAASAALLKRSPERYLGNLGLALSAVAVIGVAYASGYAAAHRLPVLAPAGSFTFHPQPDSNYVGILAERNLAVIFEDQSLRFLDFTQPSRPAQVAAVNLPLWTSSWDWGGPKAALQDGAVLLAGHRKHLPVDEVELAIVTPAGLIDEIPLGPVRPNVYLSTPISAGPFVYLGVTSDRVCSLLTYDRASKRQVASLELDRVRPPSSGANAVVAPLRILRRGAYLYVASPSYLTAVDLAEPSRPAIASQLPAPLNSVLAYGIPRQLSWQDNRLFEIRLFPETLASYNLRDPARPLASGDFIYHRAMTINGTGRLLYRPWRSGVLEFRAQDDGLEALHYLRADDAGASALVLGGEFVYALSAPHRDQSRSVHAFRVR